MLATHGPSKMQGFVVKTRDHLTHTYTCHSRPLADSQQHASHRPPSAHTAGRLYLCCSI